MTNILVFFLVFASFCSHAQDTIFASSHIEIVNGEIPDGYSEFGQYHTYNAYLKGEEIFNETHVFDGFPSYSIRQQNSETETVYCRGGEEFLNCSSTTLDTILNVEYDYAFGDTFAIRKLHFNNGKLTKSECISGCEYTITFSRNGDTLTEFKQITDSTFTISYKIFDEKARLVFDVWGSQSPIFEGFYYFDTYEWDDENYTCLKNTSASNSSPYYIEKTFYDDGWIPLRKEVNYKNESKEFDKYTIRFTRDFDSTLTMNTLPKNWIRLMEMDSKQVIYNQCAGGNYEISISDFQGKMTLLEHGEQEDSEYWVKDITPKNNMLLFSVESKYNGEKGEFTFQWVNSDKGIGRWTCDVPGIAQRNELLVHRNFRNHFPIVDQPCVDCWGEECE